ncbi:MAG: Abi family protein [Lachnospiraceae bacterium]|nr:Abi family protein [Lachnospiraceae bacterium]
MVRNKPKTINSLMKYMRDEKGIDIIGPQKRIIRNMGYYHDYKGYRFINKPNQRIPISSFEELYSIYDFDEKLKSNVKWLATLLFVSYINFATNNQLQRGV